MKNKSIYESLKEYFENTPREKITKDWEKTKHLDNVGITVQEFMKTLPNVTESSIVKTIRRSMDYAHEKKWYEIYWAFDIHGTILIPNHKRGNFDTKFYPYAKEALQLISKRDDIVMILHTASFPEELKFYVDLFDKNDIYFKYFNENPEICGENGSFGNYEKKFYFNVLFEDKAGFFPEDWKDVYEIMLEYEDKIPPVEWKNPKLAKYDGVRSSLIEKTICETLMNEVDEWCENAVDLDNGDHIIYVEDLKKRINKIFNH